MPLEFKLLTAPELTAVDPERVAWPVDTFGIVAFDGDSVVGRTAILNLPIIEGTKISSEKRGTSLLYKLIQRVEQLYLSLGKTHSWAMAQNTQPEVSGYLERLGYTKVDVTLYTKDLTKP